MVITLSMNPCMDRTVSIAKFEYGGMNRVVSARDDAGGKAVNLALVLSALGAKAVCAGLLPQEDGRVTRARLESAGVETAFLACPGRLRVNIKLLDESAGVVTEINERGAEPPPALLRALMDRVLAMMSDGDWLVLTGSLPPGCPDAYYAEIARRARGRVALDAEGTPLRLGIAERPALIKPNLAELQGLIGRKIDSLDDAATAAREIQCAGVDQVLVTLGGEGALLVDGEGALFAPALRVPVRSTVGAGDSMVAGYLAGFEGGADREERLRMGVAAAAASVMSEGTQLASQALFQQMVGVTTVRRL